jgi:hypothetical protein
MQSRSIISHCSDDVNVASGEVTPKTNVSEIDAHTPVDRPPNGLMILRARFITAGVRSCRLAWRRVIGPVTSSVHAHPYNRTSVSVELPFRIRPQTSRRFR